MRIHGKGQLFEESSWGGAVQLPRVRRPGPVIRRRRLLSKKGAGRPASRTTGGSGINVDGV